MKKIIWVLVVSQFVFLANVKGQGAIDVDISKKKLNLSHVSAGKIYKVGYRVNDAHTSYVELGRPKQLKKQQVEKLTQQNGAPVATRQIEIKPNARYSAEVDIRENDVILVNLIKR
jgi:xylan 1,4-beta-xylosidase